jgi:hypothetical protein
MLTVTNKAIDIAHDDGNTYSHKVYKSPNTGDIYYHLGIRFIPITGELSSTIYTVDLSKMTDCI